MAIEMRDITFSYGAVQALDGVDFEVDEGEVVALVGDNGAGKTTLIKVLSGVLEPGGGTIRVDGEPVTFKSPVDAREAGIETLYQDLALLDNLDVAVNFFIGREKVNGRGFLRFNEMHDEAERIINRHAIRGIDSKVLVQNLSGGQRQIIALARAVEFGTRYVILDEPTSALNPAAAEEVLKMVRDLAAKGFGVVMITHNVEHAFKVADRIVVLRLGKVAGIRDRANTSPSDIVSLIVGAEELSS
jgi:ABC-type sugar transport system ATPase subunit